MNEKLISALSEICKYAEIMGEIDKVKAYQRAIIELKKTNINSQNINELSNIRGIGPHLLSKIVEYLSTGSIKDLDRLRASKKAKSYIELSKILGVGPSTVKKWLSLRIDSLPKLRKAVGADKIKLTNIQKWGLRFYDDLNTRIPRNEVTTLCAYFKSILLQFDDHILFEIAGSYRRGYVDSGDIDIVISNKSRHDDGLLDRVIETLQTDPNFIDVLTLGRERTTFLYKSAAIARQVDILYIKFDSYYAALLYFTGSWDFNQTMRGYAKNNGYRLNQRGLYKIVGDKLEPINISSERQIFETLGLLYITPEHRNGPIIF